MKTKPSSKLWLRILLGILILCNMAAIFYFSEQDGSQSTKTSGRVTKTVAAVVVPDFQQKPAPEQAQIIEQLHPTVRKLAHMAEFGSLSALSFLFLLTFSGNVFAKFGYSLAFTGIYAATDEFHQMLSAGRNPSAYDVGIDLLGAVIATGILLCTALLIKKTKQMPRFEITRYQVAADIATLRLAVASDIHDNPVDGILNALREEAPDLILIPGDLTDDEGLRDSEAPYIFLRECAAIAPTFYSLGNHEVACYHKGNPWRHPTPIPLSDAIKEKIAETGVTLLDNCHVSWKNLTIGGLSSGINKKENRPNMQVVTEFCKAPGYRILLSHHPEYYVPYLKETDIPLILCGHAHGGQWRFFGRGVYSPGQGLFPKYTAGMLDGRCIISRGLGNHTWIPRIANRPELLIVELGTNQK